VLVNGAASNADSATVELLASGGAGGIGSETVLIAGGTGVVSTGIENSLKTVFGAEGVTRLAGGNRYATSVAINDFTFTSSSEAYFAVGTGYADALAGAARAGMLDAPLFIVEPNCVPAAVLAAIDDLGVTKIYLLGGTGALSQNVFELESC
jgi:putative cell wall-binding protein